MTNLSPKAPLAGLLALTLTSCGLLDAGIIDETCEDLPQGCDGGGDGGADGGAPVTITLDDIDPPYGLITGDDSVVISGGPFTAQSVVRFGDQEAELRSWLEGELRVDTPAADAEGWVDVTVETPDGSGSLASGYRYFNDGSGYTGLAGIFDYTHSIGILASAGDTATARIVMLDPTDTIDWWKRYVPSKGQCARDRSASTNWNTVDPGAGALEIFRTDGEYIALDWDAAEQSFNGIDGDGDVPADVMEPGTTWSIKSFNGSDWPDFSVDPVGVVPQAFELTYPELDTSSTPVLSEYDLKFEWTSDGNNDGVIIDLNLVDGGSGIAVERVSCVVDDTGSFEMGTDAFSRWEAGYTLYVKVGVAILTEGTLPLNGSDTRVIGSYLVAAAATTE